MIEYIISLLSAYLTSEMNGFWFFPFLALAFLSVFPRIVRSFFEWR